MSQKNQTSDAARDAGQIIGEKIENQINKRVAATALGLLDRSKALWELEYHCRKFNLPNLRKIAQSQAEGFDAMLKELEALIN